MWPALAEMLWGAMNVEKILLTLQKSLTHVIMLPRAGGDVCLCHHITNKAISFLYVEVMICTGTQNAKLQLYWRV